jgi:hypothetical protein
MQFSKRYFNERTLFYTVLVIMCLPALTMKYFLTLDGPSHLYNSVVIRELLLGKSPLITYFYEFNPVITPNWTGHFIMAVLGLVFNGWMTEKIFILLYLALLPLSFRYLVLSVAPGNRNLSYLIFPFSYTFLFQCGFFNFCLAFILMFFTAGWWYRRQERLNAGNLIILALLLGVTWFSHSIVFAVTGAMLGLLTLASCIKENKSLKMFVAALIRRWAALLLAAVPAIVLMIHFLAGTNVNSPGVEVTKTELWLWLLYVKPLVVSNTDKEYVVTTLFTAVYLAIIIYTIIRRIRLIRTSSFVEAFEVSDGVLLLSLFALVLLFTVPANSGAGVMSDRLVAIFFMTWVTWLALQPLSGWLHKAVTGSTLVLTLVLLAGHFQAFSHFSGRAESFRRLSGYIGKEAIVLPVNWTGSWNLGHAAGYIGTDKPMVLLDNYETITTWFPLQWKAEGFPKVLMGNREWVEDTWWYSNHKSHEIRRIDHVVLYGRTERLDEPGKADLKKVLFDQYYLAYRSPDGFFLLFTLRK